MMIVIIVQSMATATVKCRRRPVQAPRKGDYAGNLIRLGEMFARLETLSPRPAVVVLPETALTGYFLEGGVEIMQSRPAASPVILTEISIGRASRILGR